MAKKKIYAVKKGKQIGLFYNWDECKKSIDGYPGAKYKGFYTEEEAKEYLNKVDENDENIEKEAKDNLSKTKKGSFWFVAQDILLSDVEAIIDIITDDFGEDNLQKEEMDIPLGKKFLLKFNKDKVTLHYYENAHKLMMQGKPKQLFSAISLYVTELVDVDKIPEIYNNTYHIDIDKNNIYNEFKCYLPNSYNKLPEKISRTLHQAVYNLKLNGDMFDGTYLAQPVIRAIDGHLKMVLLENGIINDYKYVKINGYDMFEKINKGKDKYKLCSDRYGTANAEQIIYIGNCYTFFHNNRHNLSHWDDPTAPIDTTKLLKINEAHDLIKRTLALIDEYYK